MWDDSLLRRVSILTIDTLVSFAVIELTGTLNCFVCIYLYDSLWLQAALIKLGTLSSVNLPTIIGSIQIVAAPDFFYCCFSWEDRYNFCNELISSVPNGTVEWPEWHNLLCTNLWCRYVYNWFTPCRLIFVRSPPMFLLKKMTCLHQMFLWQKWLAGSISVYSQKRLAVNFCFYEGKWLACFASMYR